MDADIARLVGEALAGEPTWIEAATRLRPHLEQHRDDPTPTIAAIVAAFEYDDISAEHEERRARWGPFGPLFEGPEEIYPALLEHIDDQTLAIWADAYDAIDDPLLRARLGDLLWERKLRPRPDQRARGAFDAYLALADRTEWHNLTRGEALSRALELGANLNDPELVKHAVGRIARAARTSMQAEPPQPGVALRLIAALSRLRGEPSAELVDALLEEAGSVYANDPFDYDVVLNLQLALSRGDQEQTAALAREKVKTWRELAERTEGLVRLTHLQHALEIARTQGLRDEMEALRVALEHTSAGGLDLKTISAGIEIPGDEVDRFLDSFFAGESWDDWLARFGAHCPIHPTSGQVERFVDELMQHTPLQFRVTGIVLSEDHGIPLKVLRTIDEHREYKITEHESRLITFWALWGADILDRVAAQSRPSADELTVYFTTSVIGADIAERIAASLDHFWAERYDEALFVLLPRLETIIRELCRQLGLPIAKEPIGDESGGFMTLGSLLPGLRGLMQSEDRRIYLYRLLVDTLSINLRNRGLHGLLVRGDRRTAALALHAACLLRLLVVSPAGHGAEANDSAAAEPE